MIHEFIRNGVQIDIIAVQEIWQIQNIDTIQIPGFNFYFKQRTFGRGGGVGFFVNNSINTKVLENLSPFSEKTFESITIEITSNNKKIVLSNKYRSPSQPATVNLDFINQFETHLSNLNLLNKQTFIFLDSNINLLNILDANSIASTYLDSIINQGYSQVIMKATRIHNQSSSLIDHILVNKNITKITSGTLISDLSDHFFTFITFPELKKQKISKQRETRSFTPEAINNFKISLSQLRWESTLQQTDVNVAFDNFQSDFSTIYELNFPKKNVKFNKNFHKINDFMTTGLLISRLNKIKLHKKSIADPSQENISKYKNYRNLFTKLLRKSKILYFESNLEKNLKNPKKTWDLLKEAIGTKTSPKISEIKIDGSIQTDPSIIANEFNNFFSSVGTRIAEGVNPTEKDPLSYLADAQDGPPLGMGMTDPTQILNILKLMDKKTSPDLDGISLSLLKSVATEICIPLSHVFNLSLTTGIFPEKLKASHVVPIFKAGDSVGGVRYIWWGRLREVSMYSYGTLYYEQCHQCGRWWHND